MFRNLTILVVLYARDVSAEYLKMTSIVFHAKNL